MHASDCLYRPLHATLRGSSPVSSGSRAALRLSTASAVWSPRFCGPSNATAQYFSEVLRRIRARRGVVGRQPVEARPSSGAGRGRRACAPSLTCLRSCTQGRVVGLALIGEQRREPGAKRRASRRADARPPRAERRASIARATCVDTRGAEQRRPKQRGRFHVCDPENADARPTSPLRQSGINPRTFL